jgi:ligand-binding sensor domain-containing protein/serine phosphatase RsbU (regulator of sigma subunit)
MNLKTSIHKYPAGNQNKNFLSVFYIKSVLFFFITALFLCSSCSTNRKENNNSEAIKADTLIPPVSTLIRNPIVINMDTCPPSQTIIIPTQPSNAIVNLGGRSIKLVPPEIKSADFLSMMQTYTTDQGLALDAINCAIRDKRGNLWFGTSGGGASRYDGKSFTNYTRAHGLVNNNVLSIMEDREGNLWFGTDEGISRYDGKSFINYTVAQGLVNNIVYATLQSKNGIIWFGTFGGLVRYDGKTFTSFTTTEGLVHDYILCLTEDNEGNIWCGTMGGISCYDGKSFTNYTIAQGLASNEIRCANIDKSGNIWFGTNSWISRYDGKSFTNYPATQGLGSNSVKSITEDKGGNLWFGTDKGGVLCYDGKSFTNYTTVQGLANNNVESIIEDKMGNLWFGTYGGGISRYDGRSFINYTTAQGLRDNLVLSIAEDKKGNLWFGTYAGGAMRYDGKSFSHFISAQGLVYDEVMSIMEDKKGDLWFGTFGGISRYDGKSFTNYTKKQGLTHNFVMSIIEDQKGYLWFGTFGGGISRYDGKSFTNYTTAQGLTNDKVWNIREDKKGNLWIGTYGGGVSCYDGKSFTNYTTAQGLANNDVRVITEDKESNLWFGTAGNGISRYDGKSFLSYTTSHGLSDNMITQVVTTKEQNIAIGTNMGVTVLVSFSIHGSGKNAESTSIPAQNSLTNEELKSATPVFEIYNSAKGYPIKDVNSGQGGMFKDSDGILWIGTGSDKTGLVRFDYKEVNKNKIPPSVLIQSIKIDNENICWYDLNAEHLPNQTNYGNFKGSTPANITEEIITLGRALNETERDTMRRKFSDIKFDSITSFYPLPVNLVLPYQHNNVTFDFAAIEPAKPDLIQYQYLLEGYDKNWSPITNKTTATFGNIYEGTYTFKLKAQSPFGSWSAPVSYTFKVLPPWWRTWWMYGIYGILIIAFIILIVRWNGKRLKERAKELTEEIQRATKEIVEQQKIVEGKNKNITDSINYALRIQTAFLPKKEEISAYLPQSFILFKPKDIVSGDFYFFYKNALIKTKTGKDPVFIAAADCTGHGVPGAFLSMVGFERLTDAVRQSNYPSEILSLLNTGVKNSLHQSSKDESTRDGMDIAICAVDIENRIVTYAGANRPLWIIRKGQKEIEEIKCTKTAIGGLTADNQGFEPHEFTLQPGDSFYIFSDGYADIFNGETNKKLTTKKFKQILLDIQDKTMQEQERYLEDFIETWKAGTEQIDDILVIGVKI